MGCSEVLYIQYSISSNAKSTETDSMGRAALCLAEGVLVQEFDLHQWVNETLGSPNTKRDRHCRGDACEQMAANDFNDLASLALAQFDDWVYSCF